jgi:5-methylcytosine-specific restriction protein A
MPSHQHLSYFHIAMSLTDDLEAAMRIGYQRAGEEAGYWGYRFLQSINRNGGLATAQRMLKPRTAGQRKGLDALLAAGKPELTLEAIVLEERFRSLFTPAERAEAQARLGQFVKEAEIVARTRERLYPDELEPGQKYPEGARKQIRVNAFERDRRARRACIRHHGAICAVCGFDFERRYGALGKGFIHVHHLRSLSTVGDGYKVDPVNDLIPVCPNCHAMLHYGKKLLTIEELQRALKSGR